MDDGGGLVVQGEPDASSTLNVSRCYVGNTHEVGLISVDAPAEIVALTVRAVEPQAVRPSRGDRDCAAAKPRRRRGRACARRRQVSATAVDSGCLLQTRGASVSSLWVARTEPYAFEELFGDAAVVVSLSEAAEVDIVQSRFESSGRAGLANFASTVDIASSMFECNALHLDGEDTDFGSFVMSDDGDNVCGCDGVPEDCKVATTNLAANPHHYEAFECADAGGEHAEAARPIIASVTRRAVRATFSSDMKISWNSDPDVAERQMQAVIFCLVAFGYIDNDFDSAERDFVRALIAKLVDHRAGRRCR